MTTVEIWVAILVLIGSPETEQHQGKSESNAGRWNKFRGDGAQERNGSTAGRDPQD